MGDSSVNDGVQGLSGTGVGVFGESVNGTGVSAQSTTGTAVKVEGVAAFSRNGLVMVVAAKSTVTVSGVALSASSLVLANLQNSVPGVFVEGVVPNVTKRSFQIILSEAVPAGSKAKVAWFVVNRVGPKKPAVPERYSCPTRAPKLADWLGLL